MTYGSWFGISVISSQAHNQDFFCGGEGGEGKSIRHAVWEGTALPAVANKFKQAVEKSRLGRQIVENSLSSVPDLVLTLIS